MLKQRIITALILIPIFIFLVITLPPIAFLAVTGLFVLWGAFEWSFFMGIKTFPQCFIYPLGMVFLLVMSLSIHISYVLYAAGLWWLIALVLVCLYPRASKTWGQSMLLRGLMGVFVLVPCWLSVNFIRSNPEGVYTLLFLFVLIWGADTGAYFAGRQWGRSKLAPAVSPGKTWEGFIGALLTTILIVVITLFTLKIPHPAWPAAFILSIVTVLFSILGDLFESMLKRNAGLKDSGTLLPGHGGVLDRIDSLTAAAPIFALGAILLGKFFH